MSPYPAAYSISYGEIVDFFTTPVPHTWEISLDVLMQAVGKHRALSTTRNYHTFHWLNPIISTFISPFFVGFEPFEITLYGPVTWEIPIEAISEGPDIALQGQVRSLAGNNCNYIIIFN